MFQYVVCVWDGLDESEISLPEIWKNNGTFYKSEIYTFYI